MNEFKKEAREIIAKLNCTDEVRMRLFFFVENAPTKENRDEYSSLLGESHVRKELESLSESDVSHLSSLIELSHEFNRVSEKALEKFLVAVLKEHNVQPSNALLESAAKSDVWMPSDLERRFKRSITKHVSELFGPIFRRALDEKLKEMQEGPRKEHKGLFGGPGY